MTLIEGIGDDVITLLFVLFTVIIIIISWLSTNVREFTFPANLLVIERRSRRLYTASLNGNIMNLTSLSSNSQTSTNSEANQVQTSTNSNQDDNLSIHTSNVTNGVITSTRSRTPSSNPSISLERTQELELVNEIVEQALVDNLLDGEYYSTNDIELIQNHHQQRPNVSRGINTPSTLFSSNENSILASNTASNNINESRDENLELSNESNATLDSQNNSAINTSDHLINILIRFVNEKEMRIQAKPNDTILVLKKTHFGQELAMNKIVRFIYQGQFLCDKNTVKSYNIKDQTTIHCHITTKPNQHQTSTSTITSTTPSTIGSNDSTATINLNHENSPGLRLRQENFSNDQSVSSHVNTLPRNRTFIVNGSNASANNIEPTLIEPARLPHQATNTATVISIDLNNLLLPLFAVLLGIIWYFRVNFKHFFSPLSTLILFIFTFIYALFLFNNIHTTSSIAANNFMMHSRILRRRQLRQQQEPQIQAVPIQN